MGDGNPVTVDASTSVGVYFQDETVTLLLGDALEAAKTLPSESVDCIVTSPPYFGLRDYGAEGQYGQEETLDDYVATMVALFRELRRVLAKDGTFWLNIGDSYQTTDVSRGSTPDRSEASIMGQNQANAQHRTHTPGLAPKNLMGVPWKTALALQADGWILRNDVIWHKPNGMPESVRDRLTCSHEHIFMFARSQRYWFDLDPIRETPITGAGVQRKGASRASAWNANATGDSPQIFTGNHPNGKNPGDVWQAPEGPCPVCGTVACRRRIHWEGGYAGNENGKNPGDVWSIQTQPFPGAHFAVFPKELARRCIVSGCKPGGVVLDPFSGSGTTGLVAQDNGRRYVGFDINPAYHDLALRSRLANGVLDLEGLA